ncbi:MAG: glycosyltransferase family 87 protein [Anaerolineaceae bacterium]|nr:glycosyltransferase family 87 protein [Anaerolineaceae bacterium]
MWLYDFQIFYNSGQAILNGLSPYTIFDFNSPIFLALFFAPFSILPIGLAYTLFLIANLLLAWKLLKNRIIWALLFFPYLFSLFVGQIDFLLASLIFIGSPWTIALVLVKPQLAYVVIPWMIMSFSKKDWWKAIISTSAFIVISIIIQPNWLKEWLATQPTFEFFSSHSSNVYWMLPQTNLSLRSNLTIIGALIILPLGFLLKNRHDSWTILHTFAPLTNIYSPAVLLEWIGPIEVVLSWFAVLLVGGYIHEGIPFFIIGISIGIRGLLDYKKSSNDKKILMEDLFRPIVVSFFRKQNL